jgi:hypothetical protein
MERTISISTSGGPEMIKRRVPTRKARSAKLDDQTNASTP